MNASLNTLQSAVATFSADRDWNQFHGPKNLAMALAGEVGELVEIFQWLSAEESAAVMSSPRAQDVRDELADVLIYLVRLADVLGVDLIGAGLEASTLRIPVRQPSLSIATPFGSLATADSPNSGKTSKGSVKTSSVSSQKLSTRTTLTPST